MGGFCSLGSMPGVDGGADVAVLARVQVGWSGFEQLVPLLANGGASLIVT